MTQAMSFSEVVEAADRLAADEQEALVEILRRRLSELKRHRLEEEIREARRDHADGRTAPASVDDLMGEILS